MLKIATHSSRCDCIKRCNCMYVILLNKKQSTLETLMMLLE